MEKRVCRLCKKPVSPKCTSKIYPMCADCMEWMRQGYEKVKQAILDAGDE